VVDRAVLPEHRGDGLGKMIMREIAASIERDMPESGYVHLLQIITLMGGQISPNDRFDAFDG
jgi:ribosomal protein S18 acetylase RimI-like enzyme